MMDEAAGLRDIYRSLTPRQRKILRMVSINSEAYYPESQDLAIQGLVERRLVAAAARGGVIRVWRIPDVESHDDPVHDELEKHP